MLEKKIIKLQTVLSNVCSVIIVTPAGRAEEPLQKPRSKGVKIPVVFDEMDSLPLSPLTATVVFFFFPL